MHSGEMSVRGAIVPDLAEQNITDLQRGIRQRNKRTRRLLRNWCVGYCKIEDEVQD